MRYGLYVYDTKIRLLLLTYMYHEDFEGQIVENLFRKYVRFYQKKSYILSRIWYFRSQSVYYTCRANKELNRNINFKACFLMCAGAFW